MIIFHCYYNANTFYDVHCPFFMHMIRAPFFDRKNQLSYSRMRCSTISDWSIFQKPMDIILAQQYIACSCSFSLVILLFLLIYRWIHSMWINNLLANFSFVFLFHEIAFKTRMCLSELLMKIQIYRWVVHYQHKEQ